LEASFLKRTQRAAGKYHTVSIFKKQPGSFESESAIGSGNQGGFLLHVGIWICLVMGAAVRKARKSLSQDRG
jgi:hypothetical protein